MVVIERFEEHYRAPSFFLNIPLLFLKLSLRTLNNILYSDNELTKEILGSDCYHVSNLCR